MQEYYKHTIYACMSMITIIFLKYLSNVKHHFLTQIFFICLMYYSKHTLTSKILLFYQFYELFFKY